MLISDPDMVAAIDAAVQKIRAGDFNDVNSMDFQAAGYNGLADVQLNEPCGYKVMGTGSNKISHPATSCELVFVGETFRTQFGERKATVFRYAYAGGKIVFEIRLCWEDTEFHENIIVILPKGVDTPEQKLVRAFVTNAPLDVQTIEPDTIRASSWGSIA